MICKMMVSNRMPATINNPMMMALSIAYFFLIPCDCDWNYTKILLKVVVADAEVEAFGDLFSKIGEVE